jgi:hypothetical protein
MVLTRPGAVLSRSPALEKPIALPGEVLVRVPGIRSMSSQVAS